MAPRFTASVHGRSHPILFVRKQILVRALATRNLMLRAKQDGVGRSEQIDLIYESAMMETREAMVRGSQPLEPYLLDVDQSVDAMAKRVGNMNAEQQLLVNGLRQDLKHRFCNQCLTQAAPNSEPCNGTYADYHVMGENMTCWTFITDLFKELVSIVDEYYTAIVPSPPDSLTIELQTIVAANDELGANSTYANDTPQARTTQVQLELPATTLTEQHLTHLPYVLFHELLVHAAESLTDPLTRQTTKDTCAFREGYLDAAAAELLMDVCETAPKRLRTFHEPFSQQVLHATHRAHALRQHCNDPAIDANSPEGRRLSQVYDARQRGNNTHFDVSKVIGTDGALRIGIALNAFPLTETERVCVLEFLNIAANCTSSQRAELVRLCEACRNADASSVQIRRAILQKILAMPDF